MNKGFFVIGTGTDVGKTYVSAVMLKKMQEKGVRCAYYKPVQSGGGKYSDCDAVRQIAGVDVYNSYSFEPPVSPHLAAKRVGVVIEKEKIAQDFAQISAKYDQVLVEGAGGIFTPLGEDLILPDIIKMLGLDVIIVADAGLGTINATVLTLEYTRNHGIKVKGVILNNYDENNEMHTDNKAQIEKYTEVIECFGHNEI